MTASANKQVSQMKADAAKSWDEAQTIMIMTKARETEASLKFEEADNLRRELENKLASIAKIGGK
jgi:predicted AlkP superfamily phosphohydrolase/phosphomutase